jgi:hypothetical protein
LNIFLNSPQGMPAKTVNGSLCLPDTASISPGCCLPGCVHQPASAGLGLSLPYVLSAAPGLLRAVSYRDQVRQRP